MRFNSYESAVLINAALEDEVIEQVITKLQDAITQYGGTLTLTDKWGRKRLAYPIKKSKIGYYVIFQFDAPVTAISQIERIYRLEESILRFMNLKLSKFALEHFADQKTKEAAAKALEAAATPPPPAQEVVAAVPDAEAK